MRLGKPFPEQHLAVASILLLLIAGLAVALLNERYPLSAAHWDSSIYLRQAKQFSHGGYIQNYRGQAAAISDSLHGKSESEAGLEYWRFTRLGHIALAGTIVGFTGTDEASIAKLSWTYRVIFTAGIFYVALFAFEAARTYAITIDFRGLYLGTLLSLALYLLSDVGSYLSGNLVSEVPAVLTLGFGAWALLRAFARQSLAYAAAAGISAFLLYVVGMEGVWSYVSLLGLAVVFLSARGPERGIWWPGVLVAAVLPASLFAVYSLYFYPLTDPRLLIAFVNAVVGQHVTTPLASGDALAAAAKSLVVAIGFLVVGVVLALPLARRSRIVQFGIAWFVLISLVQLTIAAVGGGVPETRKFVHCIVPAFLLSTVGWANLLSRSADRDFAAPMIVLCAVCVPLFLISFPASYAQLRQLPGMWRLQYAREWLAIPNPQRVDFRVPELSRVHRYLESLPPPVTVVASPQMQAADHHFIIDFLNGAASRSTSGSGTSVPRGNQSSRAYPFTLLEGSADANEVVQAASTSPRGRVLLLSVAGEEWGVRPAACPGTLQVVLKTQGFQLTELLNDCR